VPDPYFPLAEGVGWIYAETGPVIQRIFKIRVEPQVELEVEDLVTHAVRPRRAWVLREEDAPKPIYAAAGEEGIEFFRKRHLSAPERQAVVLKQDLRWAGESSWSVPFLHYSLRMQQYRRAGEEDVLVPAGRFRCLKILADDGETGAVWLAPGVGIVREAFLVDGLDRDRYCVVDLCATPADVRRRA